MTRNHQLGALDLRRQATLDIVINISRQDSRDARRGPYAQYARTSIARRGRGEAAVWPEHIERNAVPAPGTWGATARLCVSDRCRPENLASGDPGKHAFQPPGMVD
ncbi:MAG: hypothetical protein MK142_00985, partial [Pseudomonadales bacterium]|nr:hypothetical protein [Pseudomonadales bacterium]